VPSVWLDQKEGSHVVAGGSVSGTFEAIWCHGGSNQLILITGFLQCLDDNLKACCWILNGSIDSHENDSKLQGPPW